MKGNDLLRREFVVPHHGGLRTVRAKVACLNAKLIIGYGGFRHMRDVLAEMITELRSR